MDAAKLKKGVWLDQLKKVVYFRQKIREGT